MAAPYTAVPVTAAQIGTYFIGHYYGILEKTPEIVYHFYTDASTMIRIDGNNRDTASGMQQIHSLVMSLNFAGVEIRTAQSLESWSAGVLVMLSGSVQLRSTGAKRNFIQTLFLAPQESGYFVLNDIFHFVDEVPLQQHETVLQVQSNLDSKLMNSNTIPMPDSNYMMGAEIETREFAAPTDLKENCLAEEKIPHSENALDENSTEEINALLPSAINNELEPPPAPVDEPPKHTYASILLARKGLPAPSVASQPSLSQSTARITDRNHVPQSNAQQSSSVTFERSGVETSEEISTMEDEGEMKSVYVKNLPPTVSTSEIEEQLKCFGKIRPDGVVIRGRKDVTVSYAFVEFENINGAQNAIKASPVEIAGRDAYIEERKANSSNNLSRGGRRRGDRGRGNYPSESPRGRFGTRPGPRGRAQDGNEPNYNRPRGNGFHRQVPRQEKGSRNGESPTA